MILLILIYSVLHLSLPHVLLCNDVIFGLLNLADSVVVMLLDELQLLPSPRAAAAGAAATAQQDGADDEKQDADRGQDHAPHRQHAEVDIVAEVYASATGTLIIRIALRKCAKIGIEFAVTIDASTGHRCEQSSRHHQFHSS